MPSKTYNGNHYHLTPNTSLVVLLRHMNNNSKIQYIDLTSVLTTHQLSQSHTISHY